MKKLIVAIAFLMTIGQAFSQIAQDIMIGGGLDLIKTDNSGFVEKAQFGAEVNYFIDRKFTGTAGLDFWTGDRVNFVIGGRWYPMDDFFVRARGLISANDLSIGAGWSKPFMENWRFEAMGDFYFRFDFSVRAGVAYVIRRNK